MNVDYLKKGKAWLLAFLFLFLGFNSAQAEIELTDNLTMSAFLRQTVVLNTGVGNPNLLSPPPPGVAQEKNRLNLMRTMFQVELNYRPTDIFRMFTKMRVYHDQTQLLDHRLDADYDAFPWTQDHHGLDLRTGYGEDHFNADIAEFWINFESDLFWVRLGKQSIAWGDVPGLRIADVVNPLDRSWHRELEPEEFENIRIPEWAARVYFYMPETMTGPFHEIFIDGWINPGDIHPDMQPAVGSPYDRGARGFSGTVGDPDFTLRGETEWGVRLGFGIGQLSMTLNYANVHNDWPIWDFFGAPEEAFTPAGTVYPEIDVYAMTASYAFTGIRTVVNMEASYTPDCPWQSTAPGPPAMEEGAFLRAVFWAERDFHFMSDLSRFFYDSKLLVLYYRHHIFDSEKVKLSPAPLGSINRLDWDLDTVYVSFTQGFGEGKSQQINPGVFWNPEGGYKIQCFYKYQPNFDWRIDLGVIWQGGSGDRAFLYSNQPYQDEVYFRITYDF